MKTKNKSRLKNKIIKATLGSTSKASTVGVYTVESIELCRTIAGSKKQYFVKWEGYDPTWNTWEPEENILDRSLILEFENRGKERLPLKFTVQFPLPKLEVQLIRVDINSPGCSSEEPKSSPNSCNAIISQIQPTKKSFREVKNSFVHATETGKNVIPRIDSSKKGSSVEHSSLDATEPGENEISFQNDISPNSFENAKHSSLDGTGPGENEILFQNYPSPNNFKSANDSSIYATETQQNVIIPQINPPRKNFKKAKKNSKDSTELGKNETIAQVNPARKGFKRSKNSYKELTELGKNETIPQMKRPSKLSKKAKNSSKDAIELGKNESIPQMKPSRKNSKKAKSSLKDTTELGNNETIPQMKSPRKNFKKAKSSLKDTTELGNNETIPQMKSPRKNFKKAKNSLKDTTELGNNETIPQINPPRKNFKKAKNSSNDSIEGAKNICIPQINPPKKRFKKAKNPSIDPTEARKNIIIPELDPVKMGFGKAENSSSDATEPVENVIIPQIDFPKKNSKNATNTAISSTEAEKIVIIPEIDLVKIGFENAENSSSDATEPVENVIIPQIDSPKKDSKKATNTAIFSTEAEKIDIIPEIDLVKMGFKNAENSSLDATKPVEYIIIPEIDLVKMGFEIAENSSLDATEREEDVIIPQINSPKKKFKKGTNSAIDPTEARKNIIIPEINPVNMGIKNAENSSLDVTEPVENVLIPQINSRKKNFKNATKSAINSTEAGTNVIIPEIDPVKMGFENTENSFLGAIQPIENVIIPQMDLAKKGFKRAKNSITDNVGNIVLDADISKKQCVICPTGDKAYTQLNHMVPQNQCLQVENIAENTPVRIRDIDPNCVKTFLGPTSLPKPYDPIANTDDTNVQDRDATIVHGDDTNVQDRDDTNVHSRDDTNVHARDDTNVHARDDTNVQDRDPKTDDYSHSVENEDDELSYGSRHRMMPVCNPFLHNSKLRLKDYMQSDVIRRANRIPEHIPELELRPTQLNKRTRVKSEEALPKTVAYSREDEICDSTTDAETSTVGYITPSVIPVLSSQRDCDRLSVKGLCNPRSWSPEHLNEFFSKNNLGMVAKCLAPLKMDGATFLKQNRTTLGIHLDLRRALEVMKFVTMLRQIENSYQAKQAPKSDAVSPPSEISSTVNKFLKPVIKQQKQNFTAHRTTMKGFPVKPVKGTDWDTSHSLNLPTTSPNTRNKEDHKFDQGISSFPFPNKTNESDDEDWDEPESSCNKPKKKAVTFVTIKQDISPPQPEQLNYGEWKKQNGNSSNTRRDSGSNPRVCYKCQKMGHIARDCANPSSTNSKTSSTNFQGESRSSKGKWDSGHSGDSGSIQNSNRSASVSANDDDWDAPEPLTTSQDFVTANEVDDDDWDDPVPSDHKPKNVEKSIFNSTYTAENSTSTVLCTSQTDWTSRGDSSYRGSHRGGSRSGSRVCFRCNKEGHISRDCSEEGGTSKVPHESNAWKSTSNVQNTGAPTTITADDDDWDAPISATASQSASTPQKSDDWDEPVLKTPSSAPPVKDWSYSPQPNAQLGGWSNPTAASGREFQGRGTGGYRGGSRGGSRVCFRCNKEGHISRDCTEVGENSSTGRGRGGHRGSSRGGSRVCFRCNKEGHISRDCTESNGGNDRTRHSSNKSEPSAAFSTSKPTALAPADDDDWDDPPGTTSQPKLPTKESSHDTGNWKGSWGNSSTTRATSLTSMPITQPSVDDDDWDDPPGMTAQPKLPTRESPHDTGNWKGSWENSSTTRATSLTSMPITQLSADADDWDDLPGQTGQPKLPIRQSPNDTGNRKESWANSSTTRATTFTSMPIAQPSADDDDWDDNLGLTGQPKLPTKQSPPHTEHCASKNSVDSYQMDVSGTTKASSQPDQRKQDEIDWDASQESKNSSNATTSALQALLEYDGNDREEGLDKLQSETSSKEKKTSSQANKFFWESENTETQNTPLASIWSKTAIASNLSPHRDGQISSGIVEYPANCNTTLSSVECDLRAEWIRQQVLSSAATSRLSDNENKITQNSKPCNYKQSGNTSKWDDSISLELHDKFNSRTGSSVSARELREPSIISNSSDSTSHTTKSGCNLLNEKIKIREEYDKREEYHKREEYYKRGEYDKREEYEKRGEYNKREEYHKREVARMRRSSISNKERRKSQDSTKGSKFDRDSSTESTAQFSIPSKSNRRHFSLDEKRTEQGRRRSTSGYRSPEGRVTREREGSSSNSSRMSRSDERNFRRASGRRSHGSDSPCERVPRNFTNRREHRRDSNYTDYSYGSSRSSSSQKRHNSNMRHSDDRDSRSDRSYSKYDKIRHKSQDRRKRSKTSSDSNRSEYAYDSSPPPSHTRDSERCGKSKRSRKTVKRDSHEGRSYCKGERISHKSRSGSKHKRRKKSRNHSSSECSSASPPAGSDTRDLERNNKSNRSAKSANCDNRGGPTTYLCDLQANFEDSTRDSNPREDHPQTPQIKAGFINTFRQCNDSAAGSDDVNITKAASKSNTADLNQEVCVEVVTLDDSPHAQKLIQPPAAEFWTVDINSDVSSGSSSLIETEVLEELASKLRRSLQKLEHPSNIEAEDGELTGSD